MSGICRRRLEEALAKSPGPDPSELQKHLEQSQEDAPGLCQSPKDETLRAEQRVVTGLVKFFFLMDQFLVQYQAIPDA